MNRMTTHPTRREFSCTLAAAALLPQAALAQTSEAHAIITRAIPSTGERLPVVGLGTASVFNRDDEPTRRAAAQVVQTLVDAGGRLIDTASTYGDAESVLGSVIDNAISGNRDNREGGSGIGYFVITMVLQMVLGVLATMIVMWFSRWREFRADAGGARLGGRANMISALRTLSGAHDDAGLPKALVAFGIAGGGGMARLFMSHPPIGERIEALQRAQ